MKPRSEEDDPVGASGADGHRGIIGPLAYRGMSSFAVRRHLWPRTAQRLPHATGSGSPPGRTGGPRPAAPPARSTTTMTSAACTRRPDQQRPGRLDEHEPDDRHDDHAADLLRDARVIDPRADDHPGHDRRQTRPPARAGTRRRATTRRSPRRTAQARTRATRAPRTRRRSPSPPSTPGTSAAIALPASSSDGPDGRGEHRLQRAGQLLADDRERRDRQRDVRRHQQEEHQELLDRERARELARL